MPAAKPKKPKCWACGKLTELRPDGRLAVHHGKEQGVTCEGSGTFPR